MGEEYKDGLYDMTNTVKSWLAGFPARLELAEKELGLTREVQKAKTQHEAVYAAKLKGVREVVSEATKLNGMLLALERYMRERLERAEAFRWHAPSCPAENGMGSCDCDYYDAIIT